MHASNMSKTVTTLKLFASLTLNESSLGANVIHVHNLTTLIMSMNTDAQCGRRKTHAVPVGRHEDCDRECAAWITVTPWHGALSLLIH